MYAVLQTGGKQYKVSSGVELEIEKIEGEVGQQIEFDQVLLVADGESVKVGRPLVEGAKISAQIVRQKRGPKLTIFKKIRRQGKLLKKGHRQYLTRVIIKEITA